MVPYNPGTPLQLLPHTPHRSIALPQTSEHKLAGARAYYSHTPHSIPCVTLSCHADLLHPYRASHRMLIAHSWQTSGRHVVLSTRSDHGAGRLEVKPNAQEDSCNDVRRLGGV